MDNERLSGIQSMKFGSKEIVFELQHQERKSLGITVHPDRRVTVRAPLDAPMQQVLDLVRKRAPWILKQQSYFLSFEPLTPPRKFVSGETHLYMGRQYRLKIYDAPEDEVKLKRGFLEVYTNDRSKVKKLTLDWYRERAEAKFPEIAEKWIARFKKYGVEPSALVIKWMEKRWGSCTPKGKIILNIELMKAPKGCIEYVIVHELCHLVHHNHSAAFLELQTKEMGDWRRWKERLERGVA
jgi:predicted metal-dependent hydrolase